MTAIDKYLDKDRGYSESEASALASFPSGLQRGLVIPAYRESLHSLLSFCAFAAQHPGTLLVLVLNRPDTALQAEDIDWAQALLDHPLLAEPYWQASANHLSAYRLATKGSAPSSSLLIVDRCVLGPALHAEHGVGLARKIGADIVCRLIADQKLLCPWIWHSDADASLPEDYFLALDKLGTAKTSEKIAAAIYPFFHQTDNADNDTALATLLYEFSLHYYVSGLAWAGSPYAYHTLGSTLAIHYQHYAQVRGFPKRAGAEDFYILNKLAKTGSIVSLIEPPIELEARQSERVPFGTGPAVKKLVNSETPTAMPLYHPSCFTYLKVMLRLISKLAEDPNTAMDQQLKNLLDSTQSAADIERDIMLESIIDTGLEKAWRHSHQHGRTLAVRQQHLQHWFDGFKTLKFIHAVRDKLENGTVSYSEWQQWLPDSFPKQAILLDLEEKIAQQLPPN